MWTRRVFYLLVAVVLAGAAIWFVPPLRAKVSPHLPASLAGLLPQAGKTADAGAGTPDKGGRRGANSPTAVRIATAMRLDMPLIERTYGSIQSPAIATINARIASQVTEVKVKDGQMVKAGDLLVVLDDRLLQAQLAKDQAALEKDQAMAQSAELDLQRAKQLVARQAGTQQAYDQAQAAAASANATVDSDKAAILADQAQLTFTRITAPIAGRLGAVQVNVGDLVGQSGTTGLMTITEMAPLKVAFRLPESVLTPIRKALDAKLPVQVHVLRSGTETQIEQGSLDFIDSAIDTASGTIAMSATIDNDAMALWPGQFADVEVEYGKLEQAVTVPSVAIQPGQSGSYVWLVKPDKTVEARNVKVARTEAENAAIASGLAAGDQVVVEGQLRLKPGSPVTFGENPVAEAAQGAAKAAAQ